MMGRIVLGLLAAGLSGCSFTLGMVNLPRGTTLEQREVAILVCKDEAERVNAEKSGPAEFLLGATLVGFPAGLQMEVDTKREAFARCMSARGYVVRPPT
jgi:hypothetical protein